MVICVLAGLTHKWDNLKVDEGVPKQKLLPACGLESMLLSPTTHESSVGAPGKMSVIGRGVG